MSALAVLLETVAGHVRRYVVLSDPQLTAVALWISHTHALDAAHTTPYLNISSAEKESGKTLLLEVLRPLVARPWFTGRVSTAVLARKIDAERSTLLLDESDAAFKGPEEYSEALRGSLNTGYRRGGVVSVCVGQGAQLSYKDFSTFCPKAIAGLDRLPSTVESRSIPVRLKRRAAGEEIERHRERDVLPAAALIYDNLAAWADHPPTIEELSEARPVLPDELSDRAADVWEPLLAIADLAGEECGRKAREAAVGLSGSREPDEDSLGVQLLADIRRVFTEHGGDRIVTAHLTGALAEFEESPWGEWRRGEPINGRGLSKLLRPYGIRTRTVRDGEARSKGYALESFEDAFDRYLSIEGVSSGDKVTTASASQKPAISKGDTENPVTPEKAPETASQSQCHPVTPTNPDNGRTGADDAEIERLIAEARDAEREAAELGLTASDEEPWR